ncbi:hypothetical protein KBD71_02445 [Candidatus Woesebacteria bacterium]|nr:hypothetical protein [Candidatus Woesebacteria bacterium]
MSKKSSMGLGALLAAAAGVVAGAVGVFLSDKDNREKVVREAKKVEHVIEKDIQKATRKVKAVTKKKKAKKTAKRK